MGLLNFLNKRSQVDTLSEQKGQAASEEARGLSLKYLLCSSIFLLEGSQTIR